MVDKVKLLKVENSIDGTEEDVFHTEINPDEDYVAAKGIAFENNDLRRIELDNSGDIQFKDATHTGVGRTLKSITQEISSNTSGKVDKVVGKQLSTEDYSTAEKFRLSGIAAGATANDTDANLRDRSTHTGSQLASTISNFAVTVLATFLTGLSLATATDIVATDSILVAIGKIQAILNEMRASVTPQPTGGDGSAGTSAAMAKADHVHETRLQISRMTSQTTFTVTSTTFVVVTGMVTTPTLSGSYLVDYDSVVSPSANNAIMRAIITKNGTTQADSQSIASGRTNAYDQLSGGCLVQINGTTDFVDLRVSVSTGSISAFNRRLRMIRVGT